MLAPSHARVKVGAANRCHVHTRRKPAPQPLDRQRRCFPVTLPPQHLHASSSETPSRCALDVHCRRAQARHLCHDVHLGARWPWFRGGWRTKNDEAWRRLRPRLDFHCTPSPCPAPCLLLLLLRRCNRRRGSRGITWSLGGSVKQVVGRGGERGVVRGRRACRRPRRLSLAKFAVGPGVGSTWSGQRSRAIDGRGGVVCVTLRHVSGGVGVTGACVVAGTRLHCAAWLCLARAAAAAAFAPPHRGVGGGSTSSCSSTRSMGMHVAAVSRPGSSSGSSSSLIRAARRRGGCGVGYHTLLWIVGECVELRPTAVACSWLAQATALPVMLVARRTHPCMRMRTSARTRTRTRTSDVRRGRSSRRVGLVPCGLRSCRSAFLRARHAAPWSSTSATAAVPPTPTASAAASAVASATAAATALASSCGRVQPHGPVLLAQRGGVVTRRRLLPGRSRGGTGASYSTQLGSAPPCVGAQLNGTCLVVVAVVGGCKGHTGACGGYTAFGVLLLPWSGTHRRLPQRPRAGLDSRKAPSARASQVARLVLGLGLGLVLRSRLSSLPRTRT